LFHCVKSKICPKVTENAGQGGITWQQMAEKAEKEFNVRGETQE
jgi:hypothetical protein